MKTHLEFSDGKSAKFWAVAVSGTKMTTTWGRLGTTGQSKEKTFSSAAEAKKSAQSLVQAKTKKGYREVANKSGKPTTRKGDSSPTPPRGKRTALVAPDFVKRFRKMVAGLKSTKGVEVLDLQIGRPATAKVIAAAEQEWGTTLPLAVADFYRQANGLSFAWTHPDSMDYDEEMADCFEFDDTYFPSGAICIPPVGDFLEYDPFYADSGGDSPILRAKCSFETRGAFDRSIYPLDKFSTYNPVGVVVGHEGTDAVFMGSDHGATFSDSCWMTLSDYLETRLAALCSGAHLEKLLKATHKYGSDQQAKKTTAKLTPAKVIKQRR